MSGIHVPGYQVCICLHVELFVTCFGSSIKTVHAKTPQPLHPDRPPTIPAPLPTNSHLDSNPPPRIPFGVDSAPPPPTRPPLPDPMKTPTPAPPILRPTTSHPPSSPPSSIVGMRGYTAILQPFMTISTPYPPRRLPSPARPPPPPHTHASPSAPNCKNARVYSHTTYGHA